MYILCIALLQSNLYLYICTNKIIVILPRDNILENVTNPSSENKVSNTVINITDVENSPSFENDTNYEATIQREPLT